MVTHILFDLCLFKHFSPVPNFGNQSLKIRFIEQDFSKFKYRSIGGFDKLGILKDKSTLSLLCLRSYKLDINSKVRPIKQASQVLIARNYLSSQTIAEEYFF